jgi:hypothetical protein
MAGHSRAKHGVASLAYVPAIHHFRKKMDVRVKPGHDSRMCRSGRVKGSA